MTERFRISLTCYASLCLLVRAGTVQLGTLSVAPIALGTLNLPPKSAVDVLKMVPTNILIDTAEIYGNGKTETVINEAVKGAGLQWGETAFAATKFAPRPFGNAKSVVAACRQSAARLGLESIHLYQIHYADKLQASTALGLSQPQDEAYWDGLADCYHSGLAANVGVCNYGPTMVKRAYEALKRRGVPLVSNQIGFNMMRYVVTIETKKVCDELGIKVLAYSPLGKGVLSGKYSKVFEQSEKPKQRYRYYRIKKCLEKLDPLVNALERVSRERQQPWPQLVYNWSICQGVIPIAGALDAAQAVDIARAIGWRLSDDQLAALDATVGYDISPSREFILE